VPRNSCILGCGGGVVLLFCGGDGSIWSQLPGVPRDSVEDAALRLASSLPDLLVLIGEDGLSCCGGCSGDCCGGCGAGFGL
jgi:hypothetical protein